MQDGTTSIVYLRARWYQPGTGTLLGVDPALDSTGQAYSYAGGDPVNGSDPRGACIYAFQGSPGQQPQSVVTYFYYGTEEETSPMWLQDALAHIPPDVANHANGIDWPAAPKQV
jgi:uncharacterized protein RhaS with RHS repeats